MTKRTAANQAAVETPSASSQAEEKRADPLLFEWILGGCMAC